MQCAQMHYKGKHLFSTANATLIYLFIFSLVVILINRIIKCLRNLILRFHSKVHSILCIAGFEKVIAGARVQLHCIVAFDAVV